MSQREFVEKHGSGLEVVYSLSGWLKNSPSNYHIQLVTGPKLPEAKQEYDCNCTVHVYSVQACIPKDPAAQKSNRFPVTQNHVTLSESHCDSISRDQLQILRHGVPSLCGVTYHLIVLLRPVSSRGDYYMSHQREKRETVKRPRRTVPLPPRVEHRLVGPPKPRFELGMKPALPETARDVSTRSRTGVDLNAYLAIDELEELERYIVEFVENGAGDGLDGFFDSLYARFKWTGVLFGDGHNSDESKQNTADMTVFVMLSNGCKSTTFSFGFFIAFLVRLWLTSSLVSGAKPSSTNALDDMGNRINELEQSINDLKAEMGVEGSLTPLDPAKQKSDEAKQDEGSA
ncbi:Asparagine-linked glycosylation 3 [Hibiscus syriacus]|uniref:DNA polymerase delta subunit 3 n=1 Tax=Hibiscus syriacus TaxID=106335 RepID=A0A6A2ZXN3_HIBSY|nr:Asparagine-linked glycosylation 3 [Hibiscus syriacus]